MLPSNTAGFMKMTKGDVLVKYARKHLGKPYRYGARPYEAPRFFDCSSFVQYLYRRIGIDLPRRSIDQATIGKVVDYPRQTLEIGDLLFVHGGQGRYNRQFPMGIGHVAMYVGNHKVIHASWKPKENGGGSVVVEHASDFLDREKLTTIKRLI